MFGRQYGLERNSAAESATRGDGGNGPLSIHYANVLSPLLYWLEGWLGWCVVDITRGVSPMCWLLAVPEHHWWLAEASSKVRLHCFNFFAWVEHSYNSDT